MRMIDADALLQEIETLGRNAGFYKPIYDGFIKTIKNAPTVYAEPVQHGRWIQDDEDTWHCSVCGTMWTFLDGGPEDNEARRCSYCGAILGEDEEYADD